MIVADPGSLRPALARNQRLLGLDVGDKTIGLALSDPALSVASPVTTIRRSKFTADATALLKLAADRGVGGLVIGLPLNMDGTEGPRCQSVRQFASNLLKLKDLPILFWDERLSTMAVERAMIAHDLTRAKRDKVVDQAAAAFILQGALDAIARAKPAP
ncbi:MAG TPA: Holliday junction resolvase RuvX [Dongiaceae bacterium]|jgi:putative Holliday junction resolvase|nr:Holliday junction resolvase RuvX [Dongiaceae bacterium]